MTIINNLYRTRYLDWYIQCRPCSPRTAKVAPGYLEWIAWSSHEQSDDPMKASGEVYFEFGDSQLGAIQKLKKELKPIKNMDNENLKFEVLANKNILKKIITWLNSLQLKHIRPPQSINIQGSFPLDKNGVDKTYGTQGRVQIDNELMEVRRVRNVIVDGKLIKRLIVKRGRK